MPKYRVTLPTGETYDIELPDEPAASHDQPKADEPGLLSKIGSAAWEGMKSSPPVVFSKAILEGGYDLARHPIKNAPAIGAMGATLGTGGGALPLIAAAGLGGAGGSFVRDIVNAQTDEPVPSTPGGVLRGAAIEGGKQAALQAGGEAVFRGIPGVLKAKATSLYQGALKPTKAVAPTVAARDAILQTGLEEGIPVAPKGFERVKGKIEDLNDQIDAIVAEGAKQGKTIDPLAVARRVNDLRGKFANQVNPEADMAALERAREEFLRHPSIQAGPIPSHPSATPPVIPIDEAQALKRGTYRALGNKAYGELKGSEIEAQKGLARGLKEEIAGQLPDELGAINQHEGRLLDLKRAMEDAMRRTGNRDAVGLKDALAVVHNPKTLPMMLFDRPGISSRAAIGMNRTGKALGTIDPEMMTQLLRLALMKQLGEEQ